MGLAWAAGDVAAAGALVALVAAAPAHADWDRGRGDYRRHEEYRWREHERWERRFAPPVYYAPRAYYAPPPYYYRAPPPPYYGPRW